MTAEQVLAAILFPVILSACSVDIAGPATVTLPTPPTPGGSVFVTMVPRLLSPIATTELPGSGPVAAPAALPTSASLTTRIPVSWAALKLSGRMVFTSADLQQQSPIWRIQSLDLTNGEISTIFQSTSDGWLYYMSASATAGHIVMSYAASPGNSLPGQQALYVMPLPVLASKRAHIGSPVAIVLRDQFFRIPGLQAEQLLRPVDPVSRVCM